MIGFNNRNFAGKTQKERADLVEAERLEKIRAKYEDDFAVWANEFEEHIEQTARLTARTADRINNFAYLNAEWFYYIVIAFAVLCFMIGWCSHDIYIRATDRDLTKVIATVFRRILLGF